MSYKILLVEDEAPIADSVAYSLKNEGFEVVVAPDGLAALSLYRSFGPDLIILDLMLPKLGGLDFCRMVRKESGIPIIMLTAKTEEIDRVVGLELGADDYVPKPFSVRELIARVRAVLRRTEAARSQDNQTRLQAGDVTMDLVRRRISVRGQQIHLPLKQFELLRILIANKDKVVSREDLLKAVWDTDTNYNTGTLDVHIRWLREKLETDPGRPEKIRTVRGVGYKIVSGDET
ncbi:MAG: response regulator transcription factor [Armatimonadetes bacterium]|nr:response regulator transcription factor [Armatimonadota bacterium]